MAGDAGVRIGAGPNKFSLGTPAPQEEPPPEGFKIFPFNPQARFGRFSSAHRLGIFLDFFDPMCCALTSSAHPVLSNLHQEQG
jgi:hypothetical protein